MSSHVTVNSSTLQRHLRFGQAITRQEGLLTHAQVALENQTSGTLAFEYRWEWTDADGMELGKTLSTWQPAVIYGKERKLMTGAGPGPNAVNFRLLVRDPVR
jgi:uncharacterized protein YcfL